MFNLIARTNKLTSLAELNTDLLHKLAFRDREVHLMQQTMERMAEKLREKDEQAVSSKATMLVGIKFRALFNGLYQPTEFKTGLGKCGKYVSYFSTKTDERNLKITQHHSDGSYKVFTYRISDIDGRIQECYESIEVPKSVRDSMVLAETSRKTLRRGGL